jgi:uncharacterized protein YndB with AHSA1/START domain
MKDKARGYAHRIDIAADVTVVWKALTEPENLTQWCSPQAQIRGRPGGLFRASVDRVVELEAHIDVFDPGRRMRLIYLHSAALPPADTVIVDDFILEPAPEGTVLRLLGSGIPGDIEWDTQYRRLRMGWQAAMARLKVYVEKQLGAGAANASRGGSGR